MRYLPDSTWRRIDSRLVLAGSPLRLFRLTDAGAAVVDAIESDSEVGHSSLVDRFIDGGAMHPVAERRDSHRFTVDDVTVVTPQFGGHPRLDGRITVDDGSNPPLDGANLRLERNCGPAAARNAGRARVTTPLIAFVDADVQLLEAEAASHGGSSWIDALLPHFDDPRVGLVAPRVLGESRSSLDLGDEPARVRAGSRVSYVPAAAIVVRTDAFDDVGGFDEALRFGEDVDLVWRLDDAGWRCRYEPGSQVWHEPRPSLGGRLRQQVGYGSSAAPLALRHPHALAPWRANRWSAATWLAVGLGRPVIGAGLAAGSAVALIRKLDDVPPSTSLRLAFAGHVAAARQAAVAVRRAWWPLLLPIAVFSRRARRLALVAALADPGALPTDVAYSVGVWRGVVQHRTRLPIMPDLGAGRSLR